MKLFLYRVCWVRPYYALVLLLGLCVLTVLLSVLYLEDAALKLPGTRLDDPSDPLDLHTSHERSHSGRLGRRSQNLDLNGLKPERERHRINEGLEVLRRGEGEGVQRGGEIQKLWLGEIWKPHRTGEKKIPSRRGGSRQRNKEEAGVLDASLDQRAWPDRRKGDTGVKELNSIEIVVRNPNHSRNANNPQKESDRLGVQVISSSDGHKERVIVPPRLLNLPPASPSPARRYIVYLCTANITCCGWGDRQHGILSAYLISLVTNRTFAVSMNSPCPIETLFHPRLLDWKVNATQLEGLSSRHIYTINDRSFRQVIQQIDFDAVYTEDVVYLTTNYDYFAALKANPHYTQVFRKKMRGKPRPMVFADLWQNVFKLNKRVKRRIDRALKLARPTPRHKLVCAHVRFGKNPSIPNDSEVRNSLQSVKPLWNFLAHFADPTRYRIFVSSDSDAMREKVRQMFPRLAVDIQGEIIHIDKTKVEGTEAACVGFEKVLADQYLLSMCDVLVLTYSVFGKSAAYIRRSNRDMYFMENGTIKPLQLFREKT